MGWTLPFGTLSINAFHFLLTHACLQTEIARIILGEAMGFTIRVVDSYEGDQVCAFYNRME